MEVEPLDGEAGASSRPSSSAAASQAEDEDEIILRMPVYLRPSDAQTKVCLFQYPLRPRWRPYNLEEVKAARVRPEQRRVELTLGMECSAAHYDEDSTSPLQSIQLASTSTSKHPTSYAIAMLQSDAQGKPAALTLTPLSSTVQLRPSFAQLDQPQQGDASADGSAKSTPARRESSSGGRSMESMGGESTGAADDDDDDDGDAGMSDAVTPLPSLLRPAQTEREIEARKNSHAFLVEEREKEPWSKAHLHSPDTPQSVAMRDRCFGEAHRARA